MTRKKPEDLRSHRWFGPNDLRSFGHRSRMLQMGFAREDFIGKPVIAVVNTWSEINCCHTHLRDRANEVKRGVWQAGGIPIEMPAMTLAHVPLSMESWPREGPTVRSSRMLTGAGSAPARRTMARSLASSMVKDPVIWACPPEITRRPSGCGARGWTQAAWRTKSSSSMDIAPNRSR